MLKQRKDAFHTIQPLFQAAEHATDRAAADVANCIAQMLRVRQEARLPLSTGTEMLDKMIEVLAANVSARKAIVEAHALTPELIKELGLERMFGDISPCPRTRGVNGGADIVPISTAA